jgi:hypothetical protein
LHPGAVNWRTKPARRWRDLLQQFTAELGHPPDQAELILLNSAASLALDTELAAIELANGRRWNDDTLAKTSGALRRVLASLNLANDLGVSATSRRAAKGGSSSDSDIGDLLGAS